MIGLKSDRTCSVATLWLLGLTGAVVALSVGLASSSSFAEGAGLSLSPELVLINHDPARIVGPDACAECHEKEHEVWMKTAHQADAQTLTRDAEARRIAKALGVRRIKTDQRCAGCHFTTQQIEGRRPKSVSGVSCESCHNAGEPWMDSHSVFGPGSATAESETPEHRAERLAYCDSVGMIRPARLYEIAMACYTCHAVNDQELVQAAGHPDGAGFEFASWSQGEIRHNFIREGSDRNPRSGQDRLRVMYLVGAALRLEFACRAVAEGASVERVSAALGPLRAIQQAVAIDEVSDLIRIGEAVASASDAASAIGRVQAIGVSIAGSHIGADAEPLDALIPDFQGGAGR